MTTHCPCPGLLALCVNGPPSRSAPRQSPEGLSHHKGWPLQGGRQQLGQAQGATGLERVPWGSPAQLSVEAE